MLSESDVDAIGNAVKKATGEHQAARPPTDLKTIFAAVTVAVILIGAVAAIGVSKARADEAWKRAEDHEGRITRLEVLQAKDQELLAEVRKALADNSAALQAVNLELAKRRP